MTQVFGDMLVELIPGLRAFARKLTGNADRAEDLLQDALLRALVGQDSFQRGTNIKAWATVIMRNEFINGTRRARHRRSPVAIEDISPGYLAVPPSQASAVEASEVRRHIEKLRPEHQRVLMIVGGLGYDYEEAADILGLATRGTVASRLNRARHELRQAMEA